MNVSLTKQLEKYVNDKVKSGDYQTASEVVREALRTLQEFERHRRTAIGQLRKDVDAAIIQSRRGQGRPFDEGSLARIEAMGRRRLRDMPRRKAS